MREFVIGRHPSCDVVLDDDYVSTRHARVWEDDTGQVWAEDLGSTNGTYVNGGRIYSPTRLFPGDALRIGHTQIPWSTGRQT